MQYNIRSSSNEKFNEPHIWVPKDINPKTALHLQSILRDMDRSRKRNDSLEEASVKRSKPQEPRVTVKEAMSEIQMFQEEHLKLQKEHHLLKKMVLNLEKRLSQTENLLQRCIDNPDLFALAAAGTTSLRSSTQTCEILRVTPSLDSNVDEAICTCCGKLVDGPLKHQNCKCFDD